MSCEARPHRLALLELAVFVANWKLSMKKQSPSRGTKAIVPVNTPTEIVATPVVMHQRPGSSYSAPGRN